MRSTCALTSLSEHVVPVRGVTFPSGEAAQIPFDGSIACVTTSGVQAEVDWNSARHIGRSFLSSADQVLQEGDILISTANSKELVGKCALVHGLPPYPCSFGAFVTVLRPTRGIDPYYLLCYLRLPETRRAFFIASSNTTNISNLRVNDVLALRLRLPSLDEQRRIAAEIRQKLDHIERARAAAAAQLEAAKALPAAYLREAFESAEARKWARMPLGDVALLERGKFTPRPRNDPKYYGGPYPWIQIGEVEEADKYILRHRGTLNDLGLAVSKLFPKGTLVISIAASIGAVGILGFDSCMPDSLVGITPVPNRSTTDFLYYTLLFIRDHLKSIAPQMAQANLKLSMLNPLIIPVPSLAEQHRIVQVLNARMNDLAALRNQLEQQVAALDALQPSILSEEFGAGLRSEA